MEILYCFVALFFSCSFAKLYFILNGFLNNVDIYIKVFFSIKNTKFMTIECISSTASGSGA